MIKQKERSFPFRTFVKSVCFTVLLLGVFEIKAQVTTNGGSGLSSSYASLSAAITALNAATITSPVVINLTANQTAPAGGYAITAEGTSTNTITIIGNSNTITAAAGQASGALTDAIFKLVGADWVTIRNFNMIENAANTTTAAGTNNMTEWGVALLYSSATNGAQNNTIKDNTITLNRTYQNTFGIYSNSTHTSTAVTTSVTATGTNGGNHNLKIYGNNISNVNIGILIIGPTAAADQNDGLDIGGTGTATGNTITNYGTTGTFSGFANVSGSVNGVLIRNTKNFNISYNTITSSNGGVTAGTLRGVYIAAFTNVPTGTINNMISNNNISLKSGLATGATFGILNEGSTVSSTTSLNINNNDFNNFGHTVAATGAITLISNVSFTLNTNINNNTFTNLSVNTSGNFTFISNSVTHPAGAVTNVNNNAIVTAFSKTGAGGTVYFYDSFGSTTSGTETNNGNNFSNVTLTGATTLGGFRSADGGTASYPSKTVTNNTFNNITNGSASTTILNVGYSLVGGTNNVSGNKITNITGANSIIGITSAAGDQNFFNNTISGLLTTGGNTVSAITITGGTLQSVYKNKIYDIEANNAAGAVNGILVSGSTYTRLYNNIIGDLRTPASNASAPLTGINITGGSNIDVFYNTVQLNANSTGASFGSSAISASTTPTVLLQNNIFVNQSTPTGTGLAVAYRRSGTSISTYNTASNNNLYFGTAIFTDGTNTDITLADYKTRITDRDDKSISETPNWASTTGSNSNFLHINTVIPTSINNGGTPITGITDDFDGDARNASTPDIGADEFDGESPLPVRFISFVAKKQNSQVAMEWKVASEQNSSKYVIYRAGHKGIFTKLAEVKSTGSDRYTYIDKNPLAGHNYYKLTQVDFDDTENKLDEKLVIFDLNPATISFYPNPTERFVNLNFTAGKYHTLSIYDVSGKKIKQINLQTDESEKIVDLASYTAGIYLMKLAGPNNSETVKINKK